MDEKERFIADLYPAAIKVSQETGMAWQTILAQAAQETGWGQHQLQGTHNIFNIKADGSWHGPSKTFNVWEIENDQKIWKDQSFRVYDSYEAALRDRIEFLRDNPRYVKAGLFDESTKGSFEKEAAALQRAGYATDPHYAKNLVRVFDSLTMQRTIKEVQSLKIEQGAHGVAIHTLQTDLAALGYTDGHGHPLKADGDFGLETRHAVERFQRDHHLTVDGVVGHETQHALDAALQEHAPNRGAATVQASTQSTVETALITPLGAAAPALQPFSDPQHPQYALYSTLRELLPEGTTETRLAQATAACYMNGIKKPDDLDGIYAQGTQAVFTSRTLIAKSAVLDLSVRPPTVQQTMQQVQAHDQQQAQMMQQIRQELSQQQTVQGPVLGSPPVPGGPSH